MIELIPAIDIIGGKCVRLAKGDYAARTTYSDNPLEIALRLQEQGFRRLHVVDLDGAKENHIVNLRVLESIASQTRLVVDFGGGIKNEAALQAAFDSGAAMVTIGSLAATSPELVAEWAATCGADRLIVGADAMEGRIRIKGWKEDGGMSLEEFVAFYMQRGITRVLCTDISRDGMLSGPNIPLYRSLMQRFPGCRLIASGGVSCTQDILALDSAGVPSVVFGKAYYEGRLDVSQLLQHQ
ncbi:MAG: 1-(5-phosphoribosyl)-5-[(5-phosphoribosylamino)methylideneamino]imidazole-4-carboxamide isomerase [Akkermansiaceae bacterium]|nr:1-(5-phosphoribosyl)-5-[(5-phosphoribosylamino)methylideneamino]imidazole-4-carboxamide isomerase [Akkermansiaceae bacterium]